MRYQDEGYDDWEARQEAARQRAEERRQQQEEQQQQAAPPPPESPPPFDRSRVPAGVPVDWAEDFIRRNPGDYGRIAEAYGRPQSGAGNVVQSWQESRPDYGAEILNFMKEQQAKAAAAEAERKSKADALYTTLLERSKQGLAVDRNTPVVRTQADAYSANEERARRQYLDDLAERSGPYANLRGEQRLAAERVGQRTAGFEAELLGRELSARRQEIADSLAGMQGMLSGDQAIGLQRELAAYDNAIKQQGIGLQSRGLDLDWQRALMQNDQFMRDLGLREWDRNSYWDAIRRGLLN